MEKGLQLQMPNSRKNDMKGEGVLAFQNCHSGNHKAVAAG
jgi:hypothetical protein